MILVQFDLIGEIEKTLETAEVLAKKDFDRCPFFRFMKKKRLFLRWEEAQEAVEQFQYMSLAEQVTHVKDHYKRYS